MNWINTSFYTVILISGLCWIILRLPAVRRALPSVIVATLQWFAELFWVVTLIFLLRSWGWEPFRIPSASMMPTLENNDFIVVNKHQYGLRLPGFNVKFTEGALPSHGDVVVFRYPPDPRQDYIKRVVAVPRDMIEYRSEVAVSGERITRHKVLLINGVVVEKTPLERPDTASPPYLVFTEMLRDHPHQIREREDFSVMNNFPQSDDAEKHCQYQLPDRFRCEVPPHHYFVMGDNRDESADSRYWGFVPEENIIGGAFYIWFNTGKFDRIGAIH